jgi:hypothetical protein
MHKWQRLSEIDLRRITCCIQNMRMLCNSTFLFDKATNFSPKLEEFREIVHELAVEEKRKVAVFSEYERMTHLASQELTKLKIGWVSLQGNVPARKRGELIARFGKDPDCKVFLSTDAGGVGLNLQMASAVVIFEPPWNPARLEQRIGRVHRFAQTQPVQVIHRLTEKSIEERVWETLKLKKALFTGLFDEMKDEISFEKLGRKNMMHVIEEVFSDQPGRPKAVLTPEAPQPVAVTKAKRNGKAVANDGYARGGPTPPSRVDGTMPVAQNATQDSYAHSGSFVPGAGQAVAKFLEAGLTLLESLSSSRSADRSGLIERSLSTFLWTDSQTRRATLEVPLPESVTAERLARVITGFSGNLASPS